MLILETDVNFDLSRDVTIYKKESVESFRYYFKSSGEGVCSCRFCRPNVFGGIELSTTKIK